MLRRRFLVMGLAGLGQKVAAQADRIVLVRAYDHRTGQDHELRSNTDLDAFRGLWRSRTKLSAAHRTASWNASLRIDSTSGRQLCLYDAGTGVATMLSKSVMPHYRLNDAAALNALLQLGMLDPD